MNSWIANGARLAWMVDPYAATVSVYRAGCAAEVLVRAETVEADTVLPGFRLRTARLWTQ